MKFQGENDQSLWLILTILLLDYGHFNLETRLLWIFVVHHGVENVTIGKHIFRAPSVQIKQIERQRPMTRTLSREPIFTPKRQPQPQRSLFSLYNPPPRTEAPTPAPPLTTRRQTYGNFEPQLKSANRFGNLREGFRFGQNTPKPTQRVLSNYNAIPTPQQYVYPTQTTTTTAAPTALPRFNSLYSRLRELKSVSSLSSPNPKRFAGLNLDKELEKMRTENLKLAKPTFDDLSVSDLTQILEDTKVKKDPLVALLEGSEEINPGQLGRGQFGQGGVSGGRYGSSNGRRWSNSQVRLIEELNKDLEENFFTVQLNRENEPRLKSSPVGEGLGQFDHKEFFDIGIEDQEGTNEGSGDGLNIDTIMLTETSTITSTTTLTMTTSTTTTRKITVPKISTRITTPKATTRKNTTPKITTRKSTTPKATTRRNTTPKVTTRKSTTQKATTRKVTTPKVTTPKLTTPKTTPKSTTRKSTTRKSTTLKSTTRKTNTQATTSKPTTRKSTTRKATTRKATTRQNTTPRATTRKYETTRSRQNPYRNNRPQRLPNSLPQIRSSYLNSQSMFYHTGPSWAEQVKVRSAQAQKADKVIPQSVIDYHMKRSGRIPDILRRQLDRQKAMAVSLETINRFGK